MKSNYTDDIPEGWMELALGDKLHEGDRFWTSYDSGGLIQEDPL